MRINGTELSMIRGDTETIRVSVVDIDREKVNLVDGDVVYFTVKTSVTVKEVELQKVIFEFVDGDALIKINPEDTKQMGFRGYSYDVQLTRKNGDVKTIVPTSVLRIMSEVTDE